MAAELLAQAVGVHHVGHAPQPGESQHGRRHHRSEQRHPPGLRRAQHPLQPVEKPRLGGVGAARLGVQGGLVAVVAHDGPHQNAQPQGQRGGEIQRAAPAEGRHRRAQGGLPADRAGHAEGHGQAGKQGEAMRREPQGRQLQGANPGHGRPGADHRPSDIGRQQPLRAGEEGAAGGGEQAGQDEDPARPETVEQQADGDLQAGVCVEVQRTQRAGDGRADREVAHQFANHDAGRHPLKEPVGVEQGAQAPHEPRQQGGSGRRLGLGRCAHPGPPADVFSLGLKGKRVSCAGSIVAFPCAPARCPTG